MLKRKIEKVLQDWKERPDHKPLIVKGARQIGKTKSIQKFGLKNYTFPYFLTFLLKRFLKEAC